MTKLDDAIAYLRSRNLYCLDRGTKFKWKSGSDVEQNAKDEIARLKSLRKERPTNVAVLRKTVKS